MSAFDYRNFDDRRQHSQYAQGRPAGQVQVPPPADEHRGDRQGEGRAAIVKAREERARGARGRPDRRRAEGSRGRSVCAREAELAARLAREAAELAAAQERKAAEIA